jgi:hypothetical protein
MVQDNLAVLGSLVRPILYHRLFFTAENKVHVH